MEVCSCICFCSCFQVFGPHLCSFSPLPPTFEEPGRREDDSVMPAVTCAVCSIYKPTHVTVLY